MGEYNVELLVNQEYKILQIKYEELEFPSFNKKYIEDNSGDIDIIVFEKEEEEDA